MNSKEQLEQRKADIKSRMDALSAELMPLLKTVENLRERISHLHLDYTTILDRLREVNNELKM